MTKYEELVRAETGKSPVLKPVPTPFLEDSHKEAPQARPVSEGPGIECPWCKHTFPDKSFTPLGAAFSAKSKQKKPEKEPPQAMNKLAASVLMRVLYAARIARFDLLRPTVCLARKLTRWTSTCDKELLRLMSYVKYSTSDEKDIALYGYIGDDPKDLSLHIYADADFAGDVPSQKSTTGIFLCLQGPRSFYPLHALCKLQGSVASSTPEAELVAGHTALKDVLLPALDLWEVLLGPREAFFHEDNSAMMTVVETGRNQAMKHLHRVHRISVAFLHEHLGKGNGVTKMVLTPTDQMKADIYTNISPINPNLNTLCA